MNNVNTIKPAIIIVFGATGDLAVKLSDIDHLITI